MSNDGTSLAQHRFLRATKNYQLFVSSLKQMPPRPLREYRKTAPFGFWHRSWIVTLMDPLVGIRPTEQDIVND